MIEYFDLDHKEIQSLISGVRFVGKDLYIPLDEKMYARTKRDDTYTVFENVYVTVGVNPSRDYLKHRIECDIDNYYEKVAQKQTAQMNATIDLFLS